MLAIISDNRGNQVFCLIRQIKMAPGSNINGAWGMAQYIEWLMMQEWWK